MPFPRARNVQAADLWGTISSLMGGSAPTAGVARPDESEDKAQQEKAATASKVLFDFCETYPVCRVVPSAAALDHLWEQCSALPAPVVADALCEQLGWTSSDEWQGRLRALHVVENFQHRGAVGRDIAVVVASQGAELLKALVEVLQCKDMASLVIRNLLRPGASAGLPAAAAGVNVSGPQSRAPVQPVHFHLGDPAPEPEWATAEASTFVAQWDLAPPLYVLADEPAEPSPSDPAPAPELTTTCVLEAAAGDRCEVPAQDHAEEPAVELSDDALEAAGLTVVEEPAQEQAQEPAEQAQELAEEPAQTTAQEPVQQAAQEPMRESTPELPREPVAEVLTLDCWEAPEEEWTPQDAAAHEAALRAPTLLESASPTHRGHRVFVDALSTLGAKEAQAPSSVMDLVSMLEVVPNVPKKQVAKPRPQELSGAPNFALALAMSGLSAEPL